MRRKVSHHALSIYFRQGEFELFQEAFQNSNYQKRNDFARKLLTGKPVRVIYRNRSLDDLVEMGVGLRKDLKRVLSGEMLNDSEKDELKKRVISIEENLIKLIEVCKQI